MFGLCLAPSQLKSQLSADSENRIVTRRSVTVMMRVRAGVACIAGRRVVACLRLSEIAVSFLAPCSSVSTLVYVDSPILQSFCVLYPKPPVRFRIGPTMRRDSAWAYEVESWQVTAAGTCLMGGRVSSASHHSSSSPVCLCPAPNGPIPRLQIHPRAGGSRI